MDKAPGHIGLSELLADRAWLRRLAARIGGESVADDLVQETWIAATRRPPDADRPARPWLARVLRNSARMRRRAEQRRAVREAAALPESGPSPEALVERLEMLHRLAGLVRDLEERDRTIVLLTYAEEMTSTEIAVRVGMPAGTVRWRLKSTLQTLRSRLDGEDAGRRRTWARARALTLLWKGLVPMKAVKIAAGLIALLLLLLAGRALTRGRGATAATGTKEPRAPTSAAAPALPPSSSAQTGREPGVGGRIPGWFVQDGAASSRIAGRVVLPDGRPAAGARVRLTSVLTDVGVAPVVEVQTEAKGGFDLGVQPPGRYRVSASAPGYASAEAQIDLRGPRRGEPHEALRLALADCTNRVEGMIADGGGAQVAGAAVSVLPAAGGAPIASDEDGAYRICVRQGNVELDVAATGYGGAAVQLAVSGVAHADVVLGPEGAISGEVLRADDGAPAAGVYVSALAPHFIGQQSGGRRATISDAAGRFRIDGVAPGKAFLRAGGERLGPLDQIEVTVEAGRVTEDVKILVDPRYRVRGKVRDTQGRPVAGELVMARGARDMGAISVPYVSAVTQPDGTFAIDLAAGDVSLVVDGYRTVAPQTLRVDRDLDGVAVEVEAMASLSGRVTVGGVPEPGAMVHTYARAPMGGRMAMDWTRPDGSYELRGLEAGKVYVIVRAPRSAEVEERELSLAGGEQRTGYDIDLPPGGSIEGVVVDESGEPVPGARLRLHGPEESQRADAASDGKFKVAPLQVDVDYRVEVRDPAGDVPLTAQPASFLLPGDALHQTGVRVVVRREYLAITGVVVDEQGIPRAGVPVIATCLDRDCVVSAEAGAGGAFRVDRVTRGRYRMEARNAAGARSAPVEVNAGGDVRLVVPEKPPGRIAGTVTGFGRPPEVRVQAAQPPYDTVGAPVAKGAFEVGGLASGDYVVTAQAPGEAAEARVTVAAGTVATVSLASTGSATVAGVVVDLAGEPVSGALCEVRPRAGDLFLIGAGGMEVSAMSDPRGAFTLAGAPAGAVDVVCTASDFAPGRVQATATAEQAAVVRVPLVRRSPQGGAGFTLDAYLGGARVASVAEGGPAGVAGLRPGDAILAVDGTATSLLGPSGTMALVESHPPGTAVELTLERGKLSVMMGGR